MTARSRIPAAAPAWVRSEVAGPDRAARVVHRGADAVYLEVEGACLGVLSAAATAVPCAVRTSVPHLPPALLRPAVAWVGEGRVALGDVDVVVARTVDAAVPRLDGSQADVAERRLRTAVGDAVRPVRDELPGVALDRLAAGDPAAVAGLLGRGSGLTPVGDDVLAGWLATVVASSRRQAVTTVSVEVTRQAPAATTLLSATLLDCARRGDVIPQFRAVLLDLTDPRGNGVDDSVDALLRVGHTSGAGMVLGTLLALRHLASRSTT
jgi:hypothetical protein